MVNQSDVWRFEPKTGPPSALTAPLIQLPSLPNNHVMIPQCSTLWPIEDVGKTGYCYGWVLNSRLVCVAGVLQVGSLRQLFSLTHAVLLTLNVTRRTRRSPLK